MTDQVVERQPKSRKAELARASFDAGFAAQKKGDLALARRLYMKTLDDVPFHAPALHWLGVLDYLEGDINLALTRVGKAVELEPGGSDMLDNYGTILLKEGRRDEALSAYHRAVAADSENAHAIINLAALLSQLNQHSTAKALAEKVIKKNPQHKGALDILGHVALAEKNPARALEYFNEVMRADPRQPEAHYNMGVALQEMWRMPEAVEAYQNALALNPDEAKYHVNKGAAHLKLQQVNEAAHHYTEALRLQPGMAEAHYNLAMCEFLRGNYPAATAHYEWRERVGDHVGLSAPRQVAAPRWNGSSQPEKTLLLVHEQGLGDMIHFIRFAVAAASRVKKVIVEVQKPLKTLFAQSFPMLEVYGTGEALPPIDIYAPIMSLPHLLGLELAQLPAIPMPYLKADPARTEKWRQLLASKPGVRVGLRWQGNPKAKVERGRSMPLAELAPLAAIPGVRLISLQKDDGAEQIDSCGFSIEEFGSRTSGAPDDFLDTAALIANLDLVITVDTSIAHLAGAMGRPTWVMLKFAPDWRWLMERTDTPWYPTIRLFRSKTENSWPEVVERLTRTLEKGVEKRKSRGEGAPPATHSIESPTKSGAALEQRIIEAVALHQAGKVSEAALIYAAALKEAPGHPVAHHYLGVACLQQNDPATALTHLEQALEVDSDNAELYCNQAIALKKLGRLPEALTAINAALDLRPEYPEALNNRGNILLELGRLEEAVIQYRAAVRLSPSRYEFQLSLGNALSECHQLDEAVTVLAEAVRLAPSNPEVHFDHATALLTSGQWQAGWAEYEWRRRTAAYGAISALPQPEWDGAPAPDKVLLLHAEQGRGDTFQFIRFVAAAKKRVGRVYVVAQPTLKAVLATAPGVDAVFDYGEPLPPFHLKAPLPSLPHKLGLTTEADLMVAGAYLAAPMPLVAKYRASLADKPGLKVGLVWQGNPEARADKGRSLPLATLAPLAAVPGVHFISLQKGAAAGQLTKLPTDFRVESLFDPEDFGPQSFAETAALIMALDVVITTCTSVAHLAGALGKPVWLMLKNVPDWRWQRHRADTPWYVSARLFRQPKPGDWAAVVKQLQAALTVAAGKAATTPVQVPPPPQAAELDRALALHQQGQLASAEEIYRALLTRQPQHPVALHYLGVSLYQQGRIAEAEPFIRQALAIKRDYYEAMGNLGLVLKAAGKLSEAEAMYKQAVALNPDFADGHNNLGNLLAGQKKFTEALAHHRAAVRLQPGRVDPLINLGNTLGDLEQFAEAEKTLLKAVEMAPTHAGALNSLGKSYKLQNRLPEAKAAFTRVLAAHPDNTDGLSNMGVVLREEGDLEGAITHYEKALKLRPDYAEAWGNMALALHHSNRLDEAEAAYRKALYFKPDNSEARFGLATVLLLRGRYTEGWDEYRARRGLKEYGPPRAMSRPEWDGKPQPGKTLFIYAEQGLGDTLQFVRFIKDAAKRVGRVILEVQPPLANILQGVEGVEQLTVQGEPVPAYDVQCALMELPRLLGITLEKLGNGRPYLKAPPELVREWGRKLNAKPGLRVGLNWQGSPKGAIDKGRSIALSRLAPLAAIPDVRLMSLQRGFGSEQLASAGFAVENLIDPSNLGPEAMQETAAIMANLDLVITTCTSMAHLAGALGRPTWVLLKFAPDWRWLIARADSPWYPTAQLFRQPEPDDWDTAINDMAVELKRIVS